MAKVLPFHLEGKAKEYYDCAASFNTDVKYKWATALEVMAANFHQVKTDAYLARVELHARKHAMREDEHILAYDQRFVSYVARCGNLPESEQIEWYLSGWPDPGSACGLCSG